MRDNTVSEAMRQARQALSTCHDCLCTDRPDLPISEGTAWVINNRREIALIDKALDALGLTHQTDPECKDRNTAHGTRRS
jgi:hypothetical protein